MLSPMMTHYLQLKQQYNDCIVFYRLGDFYEMFYDDAVTASRELDITLTAKSCGLDEKAPMCGVPFHAYEAYAQKLIQKGYKVAICEQLTEPKKGQKIVERDVIRVITAGTLMDSAMLDENKNNYIMCIYKNRNTIGYAYSDITTGELCTSYYLGDRWLEYINDQIVRVLPSEIICNAEMMQFVNDLPFVMQTKMKINAYFDWAFSNSNSTAAILNQYKISGIKGYDFDNPASVCAVGAILQYLNETQKRNLSHLKMPKLINDSQYMYVDMNTRKNLEIEQTLREHSKVGSLLWVIDKTNTAFGARLLRNWIRQPLLDKNEIEFRLNLVELLYNNPFVKDALVSKLSNMQDIERLVGKISYGNIAPRDCLALLNSINKLPDIVQIISKLNSPLYDKLTNQIDDFSVLCQLISNTIDENCGIAVKDGNFIKAGFNTELDRFRNMSKNAKSFIARLEAKEREATGIKNLKIGYNKVFGYYIEVSKLQAENVPFRYIRKQTVSNNERYITEELKSFEEEVLSSEENAIKLENQIFSDFKKDIMKYSASLQQASQIIAAIDCIVSLATVAIENEYCKPSINTTDEIKIEKGRHPVVEKMLKNEYFIDNDTYLNNNSDRTIVLTGPNMAGKSTYMRQVALITYLAHMGSFVPAANADICLVDRIFTRVGASDDLAMGQSTFMVEMIEVSNILQFATSKSLIILDEVGRGTSTYDGLSIAWAVLEYLNKNLYAKTLFATHYHELTDLENEQNGIKNYSISIKEINGKLVFLRKIMRGSAKRSYGVEVASLAGVPDEIISRAKTILSQISTHINVDVQKPPPATNKKSTEIENILKEININRISPIEAFETLMHLQNILIGEK